METKKDLEFQLDWDVHDLHGRWPSGPDNRFLMNRLGHLVSETTAAGADGRVLDVAAAEAIHSCKISLRGLRTFVLEPSPAMLEQARRRMDEYGTSVTLVRGVAELLPFRTNSFDRVLLDSAIDHLADPDLSIREMARVLKPDGRLVISFVNYAGLSVRLSRLLYRVARALRLASREEHYFWDSPVPGEHTFECTVPILERLCAPYLEIDRAFGVSIGWMVPGWGAVLEVLPVVRGWLLGGLDLFAHRTPRLADFVFTVWRRRADLTLPEAGDGEASKRGERRASDGGYAIAPGDVVYPGRAQLEAEYWAKGSFGFFGVADDVVDRDANATYTGDPERSWLDDLAARGPFRHAAVLGCDETRYDALWLRKGASRQLDVYELSGGVIRAVRAALGPLRFRRGWPPRRVRFIEADLNFVRLPRERYDVIWSSGCLHHIVNLEHLFAEVEQALRPGGLFALHDYVGERRVRYDPRRLRRINEVLNEIPPRLRGPEPVAPPPLEDLSPFCAVRSDDILDLARERFDVVHLAVGGALFPIGLAIHKSLIESEAPEIKRRLAEAEAEAMRDPGFRPCGAYAVFRKRARPPGKGS